MSIENIVFIDSEYLRNLAVKNREAYCHARPFPHTVIDNLFPVSTLDDLLTEFPNPNSIDWQKFDAATEKKLASTSELQMGGATRFLLYQLNSSIFLNFLEHLTGIDGLIPDPHFLGGGLHQIERGGYLKIHADFNWYKKLRLNRRLNLLLYLNKGWKEDYGGHLELWNRDMTQCEKKILPIFNRCVIFSTADFAYHGHPEPLTCPQGETRKSIALYYYTVEKPVEEASDPHSTLFKARKNDMLTKQKVTGVNAKILLKKVLPPICVDLARWFHKK